MKPTDENETLSFVKRWIKAFNRMIKTLGNQEITNNSQLADSLLQEEMYGPKTEEEVNLLEEKRQLLIELFDDVDKYYEKKVDADKASDLEEWFKGKVNTFVHDTIPDATENDVKEVEETISKSMDAETEMRTSLLESEFSDINSMKTE